MRPPPDIGLHTVFEIATPEAKLPPTKYDAKGKGPTKIKRACLRTAIIVKSEQIVKIQVFTKPCVCIVVGTFLTQLESFFSLDVLRQSAVGALGAMSQTAVADIKEKRRICSDGKRSVPRDMNQIRF